MVERIVPSARDPLGEAPPGQRADCCWALRPVLNDEIGDAHFDDRDAAQSSVEVPWQFPVQLSKPCLLQTCDECGENLHDEDRGHLLHFLTSQEAEDTARDEGWTSLDGVWHCSHCPPLVDEEQAAAEARRPGPADVMLPGLNLTRQQVDEDGLVASLPQQEICVVDESHGDRQDAAESEDTDGDSDDAG